MQFFVSTVRWIIFHFGVDFYVFLFPSICFLIYMIFHFDCQWKFMTKYISERIDKRDKARLNETWKLGEALNGVGAFRFHHPLTQFKFKSFETRIKEFFPEFSSFIIPFITKKLLSSGISKVKEWENFYTPTTKCTSTFADSIDLSSVVGHFSLIFSHFFQLKDAINST